MGFHSLLVTAKDDRSLPPAQCGEDLLRYDEGMIDRVARRVLLIPPICHLRDSYNTVLQQFPTGCRFLGAGLDD